MWDKIHLLISKTQDDLQPGSYIEDYEKTSMITKKDCIKSQFWAPLFIISAISFLSYNVYLQNFTPLRQFRVATDFPWRPSLALLQLPLPVSPPPQAIPTFIFEVKVSLEKQKSAGNHNYKTICCQEVSPFFRKSYHFVSTPDSHQSYVRFRSYKTKV